MTCKFLEISSGQDLLPNKFEIVEVQNGTFMLKTEISHFGLLETLEKWLKIDHFSMEQSSYSDMLWKRSSSMRQRPSEDNDAILGLVVGPHLNLEETIEEAGQADNLFMSAYEILIQWSVSQRELTEQYGYIMADNIGSMVQTNDKNHLFVSDTGGC
jgi:hypothetical protein